jgi:arginase
MHGMPVGLLMDEMCPDGTSHNDIPGCEWLSESWAGDAEWPKYADGEAPPRLTPEDIVYVGLRDVDLEERKAIKALGIQHYTMYDIDKYGIGSVMDKALKHLLKKDPSRPIHLSYDIDAVDPAQAPATGTAVRGGLTYREAHFIAECVCESGQLASADIVELNPTLGDQQGADATTELGFQLVTSMMGKSII